jgi:hypothetical protein
MAHFCSCRTAARPNTGSILVETLVAIAFIALNFAVLISGLQAISHVSSRLEASRAEIRSAADTLVQLKRAAAAQLPGRYPALPIPIDIQCRELESGSSSYITKRFRCSIPAAADLPFFVWPLLLG